MSRYGTATECCGDDASEHYITTLCTGETTANGKCCSSETDRLDENYQCASVCCRKEGQDCIAGSTTGMECCDVADGYAADQYCSEGYCCPNGKYFRAGSCADAVQCGIKAHETADYFCPYRSYNDPVGEQSKLVE